MPINGSDELFKHYNLNTFSINDWRVKMLNTLIYTCFKILGYKYGIAFFKYIANVSDYSGLSSVFSSRAEKITLEHLNATEEGK